MGFLPLKKCCCCNVRIGSCVIGIYKLVWSLICVIVYAYLLKSLKANSELILEQLKEQMKDVSASYDIDPEQMLLIVKAIIIFGLTIWSLMLSSAIILLMGIVMEHSCFLLPFLIGYCVLIVMTAISTLLYFVLIFVYPQMGLQSGLGSLFGCVIIFFDVWAWLCVYAHYLDIKRRGSKQYQLQNMQEKMLIGDDDEDDYGKQIEAGIPPKLEPYKDECPPPPYSENNVPT